MANSSDPYFLLIYKVADDYVEKRATYRKEHLEKVWELVDKGILILGGALDNPANGAYLCFQCPDKNPIEEFAKNDPYVKNGCVVDYEIRDWKVVVGTACRSPVRPEDL